MLNYKVFISHSVRDKELVENLKRSLKMQGIMPVVADEHPAHGQHLDEKIFNLIEQSDAVLVILTKNGKRSNWVQ